MKVLLWISTLALLTFATTVASASVSGELKVSSGNGTTTVTLGSVTFNTDTASNPAGPPWNAQVANTSALIFAGCVSGVLGTAGCLDAGPFIPSEGVLIGNANTITVGASLAVNNPFLQFAGNGVTHATILYTVTSIGPGSANTNCTALVNIGDSCSVYAGSPIIWTLTAAGSAASITVAGTVTDGAGVTNWSGGFSFPITGMTPGQVQLFFCPSGTCQAADFVSGKSITKPTAGDFQAGVVTSACASPVLSTASASPNTLWPPNHKMVEVTVDYTDTSSCQATCALSVASDEGNAGDESQVIDAHHVRLAAERNGNGNGRLYTITVGCTNGGGTSTRTATVTVPHNK